MNESQTKTIFINNNNICVCVCTCQRYGYGCIQVYNKHNENKEQLGCFQEYLTK